MSSWIKRLLKVLNEQNTSEITEGAETLTALINDITETQWNDVDTLASEADADGCAIVLYDDVNDDGYNLLDDSYDNSLISNVRLVLTKKTVPFTLRFILSRSVAIAATKDPRRFEQSSAIIIGDLATEQKVVGGVIVPWGDNHDSPQDVDLKSPRHFINDASGKAIIPFSIWPWLPMAGYEEQHSILFGPISIYQLSLCLSSSILAQDETTVIAVADAKRKSQGVIKSCQDAVWLSTELSQYIQNAVRWVYCDGAGTESRHSILASEISRSYPKGKCWADALSEALEGTLESAKIAYRLHLYDKSIDALKLMSDLRKGLADDLRGVSSQMAVLSAGLWRDAAVAFGAVVFKSINSEIGTLALLVTCVYLIVSSYLNTRLVSKAVQAISDNEITFRRKLYSPLLADGEYMEVAGERYRQIISDFNSYKYLVVSTYVVAILGLGGYALWPNWNNITSVIHCLNNEFAWYVGRLFMPDAQSLNLSRCMN